jgi:hypothetical protein
VAGAGSAQLLGSCDGDGSGTALPLRGGMFLQLSGTSAGVPCLCCLFPCQVLGHMGTGRAPVSSRDAVYDGGVLVLCSGFHLRAGT